MHILCITNLEKKSKPSLLTTKIVKISHIFIDYLKFTPDMFFQLYFFISKPEHF